ncbi:hypothetical protein, partial [Pseudomonas syringae]
MVLLAREGCAVLGRFSGKFLTGSKAQPLSTAVQTTPTPVASGLARVGLQSSPIKSTTLFQALRGG